MASGIQTEVSAGSFWLGLSIFTTEPKYGQSVGLICRALPVRYGYPVAADIVIVVARREGTYDSHLVSAARRPRQQLGELNTRHIRTDWLERSPNFEGRVRLGIEGLVLRRSALQPEKDDVSGTTKRRSEIAGQRVLCEHRRSGCGTRSEQCGKRNPERAQPTDPEPFAAVQRITGAIEIMQ
jgi:hypothetical protein